MKDLRGLILLGRCHIALLCHLLCSFSFTQGLKVLNWRVCLTGVARADHLRCPWAGATTGIERLAFACLIWRQQLDDGLMQSVIRGAQLNAYLPVAPHEKITRGAEVTFPIGL